ncbi:MAG: slipin family protein [Coleofasciculaceae cyanobacterium SM2_1_6]|nr:slipin family protein [Coleofasciculaceae cyanobacterium SM2_1_6]
MFTTIQIQANERALMFQSGKLIKLLTAGKYSFFDPQKEISIEKHSLETPYFESKYIKTLLKEYPQIVEQYFTVVDIQDGEVAIVYINGKILTMLSPGQTKLFWKELEDITVEKINLATDYEISAQKLNLLNRYHKTSQSYFVTHQVNAGCTGVLSVDGRIERLLEPGIYAFWLYGHNIVVNIYDLRLTEIEVTGQEILTKDRVSIRVNLSCYYQITDILLLTSQLADFRTYLYKQLQFTLRQNVESQTLDELLASKDKLDGQILETMQAIFANMGLEIQRIGIKDIILPGEMRTIFNQVVQAEKAAQANLIKRREETAATRSLLNTARLMEDNPVLLRLKELETLENIVQKVNNLSVNDGVEGLLHLWKLDNRQSDQ